MKPLSIRWQFALWASALTGVVLLVYSVGTFGNLYHEQIETVDLELAGEARHFLELHPQGMAQASADEITRYQPWIALAHFDENGRVKLHSNRLPESLARAALNEPGLHTAHANGLVWRIGVWRQGKDTVVAAYDLEEVHDIAVDLVMAYLLSLPVVLLVAGFGGWWVAGRALVAVRNLTTAAENVQAASLDQRVPVPAAGDEINRLATVFNAMLSRLEGSFMQAQRFAADASHELRTPLTIMRGEVEQLLHANGLSPAQEARLLSVQEEIHRLDRITEHLLLLARFDAGRAELRSERVDLSSLAREACEDAELLAAVNEVRLTTKISPSVPVTGDQIQLRRLLLNLLHNATHYNSPGGAVVCTVGMDAEGAVVRVANTGPAIPPEQRERIFERFFRADPSRTERGGHGLGLSLCREIARAHGGTIVLQPDAQDGWVVFELTLPSHPGRLATRL